MFLKITALALSTTALILNVIFLGQRYKVMRGERRRAHEPTLAQVSYSPLEEKERVRKLYWERYNKLVEEKYKALAKGCLGVYEQYDEACIRIYEQIKQLTAEIHRMKHADNAVDKANN